MSKETLAKYGNVEEGEYKFNTDMLDILLSEMGLGTSENVMDKLHIEEPQLIAMIENAFT
jgi:hypothetical protein